jgi:hypothetical protein
MNEQRTMGSQIAQNPKKVKRMTKIGDRNQVNGESDALQFRGKRVAQADLKHANSDIESCVLKMFQNGGHELFCPTGT